MTPDFLESLASQLGVPRGPRGWPPRAWRSPWCLSESAKNEKSLRFAFIRDLGPVRRSFAYIRLHRFDNAARRLLGLGNHPHVFPVVRKLFPAIQADNVGSGDRSRRRTFTTPHGYWETVIPV